MASNGRMETVTPNEKYDHQAHHEELKQIASIDTVHNDEAVKVLATYDGDEIEWESEEEKRLVRKIDRKLVPLLFMSFGLVYYDKAMISQAALFGLRTELNLTGNRFSFSSSNFSLGAIVGVLPVMFLAQHYPVERVAAGIIALWGVTLILTIECHDYRALYANRFFLGFLEAAITPMFMLIVGSFYTKEEQPFRLGAWWSAAGFISMFSPLINYGLGQITGALSPWKYMYVFAACITLLWSLVRPDDHVAWRASSDVGTAARDFHAHVVLEMATGNDKRRSQAHQATNGYIFTATVGNRTHGDVEDLAAFQK